ncbi:proteinase B [Hypoxylon texense]
MHHRTRSKSQRLSRRKSTSSGQSVHLEHIHPATAERDAQAAATQAFERARGRSATDATLWPPSRNESSNATSHEDTRERHSNDPALLRQQSVRFVPSRASRSTQNHIATDDTSPDPNPTTPRAKTTRNSGESRPTSRASATGMVSAAKGIAGDYINTLFTGEEYYTPEDDIASAPSSYRRIRKSRSMMTSSGASPVSKHYTRTSTSTVANQAPLPSVGSSALKVDENVHPGRLKAPKSMSFLRSRRDHSALFSHRRANIPEEPSSDGGARASNNNEEPLKSHPSTFFRPKSMGADKFIRKSMRDPSNDTIPVDGGAPKDGSLRIRARKVSSNFKHKLKNFFSLAKGDSNEASFPPQQVKASKSHNKDLDNDEYIDEDAFPFQSAYDEAAISRVPSGVPSLHAVPSHQQLRSRQGSFESLASEKRASNERSRVTSWSNSDTNTIRTMNSRRGEWERQRLSIIKEDGVHISSSSTKLMNVEAHAISSNTSLRDLPPPIAPQPSTADGQRIYSALMKKHNNKNEHSQRDEVQRQKTVDDFVHSDVVPPRGSSRFGEIRGANIPPTIRHVPPNFQLPPPKSTQRKLAGNAARPDARPNIELHVSPFDSVSVEERQGVPPSASASVAHEAERVKDEYDLPPAIPRIGAPTPPPRALSTRSSAFFASPTCHLFRTQSPYRRAIQDSMKTESHDSQLKSPEFNPWMRSLSGLPIRRPSACESEMDKKMEYAKSIYSSMTEDPVPASTNNTSATVDNFSKAPSAHGSATIFLDPPVYRPTPPPVPKHRVTSSASSVDWKTWLAASVAKLESPSNYVNTGGLEYAIPSSRSPGHVREEAQINDEDDQSPLEVYKPTRADGVLASIEHNTRASSQGFRPASHKTSLGSYYGKGNEEADSSAIQSRNVLCSTPSIGSMGSTQEANASTEPTRKGVFDSLRRRSLAHRPSINTLAGNSTSKKLVKKQPALKRYFTPTSSPKFTEGSDKQSRNLSGLPDLGGRFGITASAKTENVSPRTGVGAD